MVDQLKIPFTVKQELLLFSTFFSFFFDLPLLLEHITLLVHSLLFLLSLNLSSLLLPIKNSHGVRNLLLFLTSFLHLTLKFLLGVKLPELSINLFFHHFGFDSSSLINKLLFSLNSRSIIVELLVFFSQRIVGSLETNILSTSNFILFLLLTLSLQVLESFPHFISDLLWCFKVIVKLLLVNAVFGCKESC